jgi:MoxR-like ATPase
MIKPEPGFTIVATANTKGDGDGSDRFVGANVMNEAFLERFNVVIEQDYPPPITEVKILKQIRGLYQQNALKKVIQPVKKNV